MIIVDIDSLAGNIKEIYNTSRTATITNFLAKVVVHPNGLDKFVRMNLGSERTRAHDQLPARSFR